MAAEGVLGAASTAHAPPCTPSSSPVQGKQVLQDGIGRAPEEEEQVDPAVARSFLTQPAKLLALGTPLLEGLKRQEGVRPLSWWALQAGFPAMPPRGRGRIGGGEADGQASQAVSIGRTSLAVRHGGPLCTLLAEAPPGCRSLSAWAALTTRGRSLR